MTKASATRDAIEAATAAAILGASHFTASIRAHGTQTTHPLKTLALARKAAGLMPEAMGVRTRALVYAVTPEGRAFMVPEDFPDPEQGPEAMATLQSLAAKLAAGQTPDSFKATNGVSLAACGRPTPASEAGKAARDDNDLLPKFLKRAPETPEQKAALKAKTHEELNKAPTVRTVGESTKPSNAHPKPPGKAAHQKPSATTVSASKQESATMTSKTTKSKARTAVKGKTAKAAHAGERSRYDWTAAEEAAAKGKMPKAPDFSAPTHERFRPLLAEVVKAAVDGNAEALRKIKVNPVSSSPKAVDRFRKLCLKALTAKKAA